jgi:hypothetical protein
MNRSTSAQMLFHPTRNISCIDTLSGHLPSRAQPACTNPHLSKWWPHKLRHSSNVILAEFSCSLPHLPEVRPRSLELRWQHRAKALCLGPLEVMLQHSPGSGATTDRRS